VFRRPTMAQNSRKLPGRSGIVTARIASLLSPSSARSATKRSRSKFMFAPHAIATSVRPFTRRRAVQAFSPATESAPAGPSQSMIVVLYLTSVFQLWHDYLNLPESSHILPDILCFWVFKGQKFIYLKVFKSHSTCTTDYP